MKKKIEQSHPTDRDPNQGSEAVKTAFALSW